MLEAEVARAAVREVDLEIPRVAKPGAAPDVVDLALLAELA